MNPTSTQNTTLSPTGRVVLADALVPEIPTRRVRDAGLVVGGALLVAALAQLVVPLPFTPVPITGQTLGVALVGASLGARRGALSLGLYVALGAVGLPFYSGGAGGWEVLTGATFGYLFGFVAAAALVGWLCEHGADRNPFIAFVALQAGSLVIFTFGVGWLALSMGVGFERALELGWWPFVPGDLLKTALAAGLLPGVWRWLNRGDAAAGSET